MGSGSSTGAGGFRIFTIVPNSPADVAGLEVFFDFVVEVNGMVVESDKQSFFSMVKDFEGKRVKLTVYNCRSHSLRGMSSSCLQIILIGRCVCDSPPVGRARPAGFGSQI